MANENIFYSKEARWFFKEKPSQLETWFNKHGAFFENEKERTDFYLSVAPAENISYKLREGKTEIKLRESTVETVIFPNGYSGKSDNWVKWSLELVDPVADPGLLYRIEKKDFVALKKKRILVKFEILRDEIIKQIGKDDFPDEGCQVELTIIKHGNKKWYSFGFEAFGSKALISRNFDLAANKILSEIKGLVLEEKDSYSYPVFLAMNF